MNVVRSNHVAWSRNRTGPLAYEANVLPSHSPAIGDACVPLAIPTGSIPQSHLTAVIEAFIVSTMVLQLGVRSTSGHNS